MNYVTTNNITARRPDEKLELRLAVPLDARLNYIESVLAALNESRSGYGWMEKMIKDYVFMSEAEVEVDHSESGMFFRPSWTAFSKFIPASGSVSVSFGEQNEHFGTSISSSANLASLRENYLSHAKIAKDAKKRKDAAFGTSLLELHPRVCPAHGPPSK